MLLSIVVASLLQASAQAWKVLSPGGVLFGDDWLLPEEAMFRAQTSAVGSWEPVGPVLQPSFGKDHTQPDHVR